MRSELELKAVVPEAARVRECILKAGAVPGFRGRMSDRRFDRGGELAARDEVLRVRTYHYPDRPASVLGWKGPMRRSAEGYKERVELELELTPESASPEALLAALGYQITQAVDRYVEIYLLDGATLRLEWYPRMDVLLEVEGEPASIERAVRATGMARDEFSPEPLTEFVRRYEARTGTPAVLADPAWSP